jgi:hypothetical protein
MGGYLCPMTLFHVTDEDGVRGISQQGFRPQKGPRSARLGERREAIYFFKNKALATDAVMGWLGDAFPSEKKLFCLEVELPDDFPCEEDPNFGAVETIVKGAVEASCVKSVLEL